MPAGLALGISIGSRHDDWLTVGQTRWGSGNAVVTGYTELVNDARHDARQQLGRDVARLGGEEFVLLLPDTDSHGGEVVAARVQEAIRSLAVKNDASPFDRRLTISIGIGAVSCPQSGVDPTVLVDCADQALYDAKHQGRNRNCTRSLD